MAEPIVETVEVGDTVTVDFQDRYYGRYEHFTTGLVTVEGGGDYVSLRVESDDAQQRRNPGFRPIAEIVIPHNYADLVAIAMLKAFVPQAAGWVGLVPQAPWQMVADKLMESEDPGSRIIGHMLKLAHDYGGHL